MSTKMTLPINRHTPDRKVDGANMGPNWVLLSAPYGAHVGPMNVAIRDQLSNGN